MVSWIISYKVDCDLYRVEIFIFNVHYIIISRFQILFYNHFQTDLLIL